MGDIKKIVRNTILNRALNVDDIKKGGYRVSDHNKRCV